MASRRSRSSSTSSLFGVSAPHFWPTLGVLLSIALLLHLLQFSAIPHFCRGFCALPLAAFLLQWYRIHGHKLTRSEHFLFDEKNLLATTHRFEFDDGPMLGDDVTPGGTRQPVDCCGKGLPKNGTLLADLAGDSEKEKMQKIYEHHYGGVYALARRREAERETLATKSPETKSSEQRES